MGPFMVRPCVGAPMRSGHLGAVFKTTADGSGYRVLHSFGDGTEDGQLPEDALLEGADGFLYGTTSAGGTNGGGTVFKLNKDGSAYGLLFSFPNPLRKYATRHVRLVEGIDGVLYGATDSCGTNGSG